MDLVILVLILALIGCLIWFITTRIPMDATVRLIIQVVAAIVLILYVIRRLGGIPNVM